MTYCILLSSVHDDEIVAEKPLTLARLSYAEWHILKHSVLN